MDENVMRIYREMERKRQIQEQNKVRLIHKPEMNSEDFKKALFDLEIVQDNGRIELDRCDIDEYTNSGICTADAEEYSTSQMQREIEQFWNITIEPTVDGYHRYHEWKFNKVSQNGYPMLQLLGTLGYKDGNSMWHTLTVVRTGGNIFKACKTDKSLLWSKRIR